MSSCPINTLIQVIMQIIVFASRIRWPMTRGMIRRGAGQTRSANDATLEQWPIREFEGWYVKHEGSEARVRVLADFLSLVKGVEQPESPFAV